MDKNVTKHTDKINGLILVRYNGCMLQLEEGAEVANRQSTMDKMMYIAMGLNT